MQEIRTICPSPRYRLWSANCYLVKTDAGYVLIDTGVSRTRAALDRELEAASCNPGDLKLILLTHGDFDHAGNAAHLRARFGGRIAMNDADAGMVERGDMFSNRKSGGLLVRKTVMALAPILFGFGKAERFKPDLYVQDGDDLAEYGFDAKVISIPGHSSGSIGILTTGGDLFCGDLLTNTTVPALNFIMDDIPTAKASLEKLRRLGVKTVYPGHGEPFPLEEMFHAANGGTR